MAIYTGYIGTYTKGDSKGVYSFTLDTESKKVENIKLAAELGSPTYVTISKDGKTLYAVDKQNDKGGITSFNIDADTAALTQLSTHVSESGSPCHVSVDSGKQYVVTANYHNGKIELYKTNTEGKTSAIVSMNQHSGSGPNTERQDGPHAHFSGFTPDEKYIVAVDLGTDEIITYEIKEDQLHVVNVLAVKPGSGPRHIEFHPNGKFAYVMTELSNEVIALAYNPENGVFTELHYISAIPADFTENSQGSAIHVSPDGKFVYAGNRGHNSIAVFSVTEETGELTFVEHVSSAGDWPRDFEIDPSGQFIVSSNQESSNLVLYARDTETGKLSLLGSDLPVPYPVCVKFLKS